MSSSKHVLVRIDVELLGSIESLLEEGESLKYFVNEAVRAGVERRKRRREFLTEVLGRRDRGLTNGTYVDAEKVIARLESILASASAKRG